MEKWIILDKSSVRKLRMTENDIYLVLVVWKDLGKLSNEVLNNKNIIIVERENLKKIYTLSLIRDHNFIVKYMHKSMISNLKTKTF